uniref:Uncharacterized protein n=1 Tax=Cyprinus carpio carpio TaxID=630221 RepID=A0A9J8CR92_CYPCA
MGVLQAYQADLLKDLSVGSKIDEEAFAELRRATDLSLRVTKQTARAIGRSMSALVSTERLSCPSTGGQHSKSLLYKSPGGSALKQSEQDSEAYFSLGPGQAPVTQGSLHSRAFECGSGFTVQTGTTNGGMETPPRGSGPLRLPSDSAMSPLLLSESPSPPGSGCDGAHMAQNVPVCISSSFSAPGSPSQSSPTRVLPLADSATLAEQSMVLGDNISPRRLAMGDSGEEGPSVSGRGHNIPSQARPVESSCLAPEGFKLRNTGLSPDVIDTILSARASSTRQSYASKWGVFDRWCVVHNEDPVNCHIASVLDFMQEKLSTGTCPATLKVYVAALSACHALIYGMPLGRHPLLSRFLRGCVFIKAPAADFEQLQHLTSWLVLFCSRGTLKAHVIVRRLQHQSKSDKFSNQNALLLSGGSRVLRRSMKSNKPIGYCPVM